MPSSSDIGTAYESDLGTGLLTGQEVGCAVKSGLTTIETGRLTCWIKVGTGPEDYPAINVEGYDKIPPSTSISILISNIKGLKNNQ